jgi:hypothetical protein
MKSLARNSAMTVVVIGAIGGFAPAAVADTLPFTPTLSVQASSQLTDAPTGLDMSLTFPQSADPRRCRGTRW